MTDEHRVRSTSLHVADRLFVDAHVWSDGNVTIEGQDLRRGEYEYVLTIAAVDVPSLVRALGGEPGVDPLPLLAERSAELVARGESRWLTDHGVEHRVFTI